MSIAALLAAAPLIPLGAKIATDTVSAVSGGFADLLKGTLAAGSTSPDAKPPAASRPNAAVTAAGPPISTAAAMDTVGLRDRTESLVSNFRGRLDRLLSEEGINAPSKLQLQLDPFGAIRVVGGSDNRQQIEQILNNDPQLADLFRSISANLGLLTAANEARALPAQFATDTLSAIDHTPHLFPAGHAPVVDLGATPFPG